MRRELASALTLALTLGILVGSSPMARATLRATADKTWMVDGIIYAQAQAGNTIYVGGSFTSVSACPPDLSCPNKTLAASNLAAFDATTGEAIPNFHPMVEGDGATVFALAVLGPKLFIGGMFASVDGAPRRNFAAVALGSGTLDPGVDAAVGLNNGDKVRGMVATASRVYVSGGFASVDGATRKHLAAFDVAGHLDQSWTPGTDGQTHTVDLNCDGTSVIAGGGFRYARGAGGVKQPRFGLAMFDVVTGALDHWAPIASQLPDDAPPYDLAATCTRLFVGTGGSNRLMALDLTHDAGKLVWRLTMHGNVQALALRGDRLLFGGHFQWVPVRGTAQQLDRFRFAVVDLHGHLQSDWVPSFDGTIHTGVWAILLEGPQIWIGGGFTTVTNEDRWGIARFTDTP